MVVVPLSESSRVKRIKKKKHRKKIGLLSTKRKSGSTVHASHRIITIYRNIIITINAQYNIALKAREWRGI